MCIHKLAKDWGCFEGSRQYILSCENIYSSLMEKSFQGRNTNEDELFFPRGNFSLSAIVEKKDSCLPSAARLDSPSERRSRKGKFPQGKKRVRDCTFLPRIRFSSMGDTFSSQFWTCSTISHNYGCLLGRHLWMALFAFL